MLFVLPFEYAIMMEFDTFEMCNDNDDMSSALYLLFNCAKQNNWVIKLLR
jgi:hypothetical protein